MTDNSILFPIGKFPPPALQVRRNATLDRNIRQISKMLRLKLEDLGEQQLDNSYREGGWTIKQIVHNLADACLHNCPPFITFKKKQIRIIRRFSFSIAMHGVYFKWPIIKAFPHEKL